MNRNFKKVCTLGIILLFLKMLNNSNIFLIIFIALISYGIIKAELENKIKYLIFFIPYIFTMKFSFNGRSAFLLFSIEYIIIISLYIYKNKIIIKKSLVYSSLFFIIFILISGIFNDFKGITSTIGFLINYSVLILTILILQGKNLFEDYSKVYYWGLITSSIIAMSRYIFDNIDTYLVNMTNVNTIIANGELRVRFAGLDLDPNYYSSNIMLSITFLSVILYYKREFKLMVKITILILLGFLSMSKMYVAVLILYLVIFIIFIGNNHKLRVKIMICAFLLGVLAFVFAGEYIITSYTSRLGNVTDINSLTTGRFNSWINFLKYFSQNILVLIGGASISLNTVDGLGAHNIYISTLFSLGILGTFILMGNLKLISKEFKSSKRKLMNYLPIIIYMILNFSLDSIYMDWFFYQLLIIIMAKNYSYQKKYNIQFNKNTISNVFIKF